jgi:hypothetical protein
VKKSDHGVNAYFSKLNEDCMAFDTFITSVGKLWAMKGRGQPRGLNG